MNLSLEISQKNGLIVFGTILVVIGTLLAVVDTFDGQLGKKWLPQNGAKYGAVCVGLGTSLIGFASMTFEG